LTDAADRPDLAARADGARAGDLFAAIELPRCEDVDDAQGEHHPGTRPADVVELDGDVDREVELVHQRDAEQPGRLPVALRLLRRDGDRLRLAVPLEGELDGFAVTAVHDAAQGFGIRNGSAVGADDDVTL